MGIKSLSSFLKKKSLYDTLDISTLRYSKVAVDTPMLLYKYKASSDPTTKDWMGQFANFVAFLRRYDIHPIFVFEGKAPPEKSQTQKERKSQKLKMVEKTAQIEAELKHLETKGYVSPLLLEIYEKRKDQYPTFLQRKNERPICVRVHDEHEIARVVKDEILRRKRYDVSISVTDTDDLKYMLDLLGVSYVQSNREAETDCVSFFYDGSVDYVMSEDTDVLAYHVDKAMTSTETDRSLKVICEFDVKRLTFTTICKKKVLDALDLSSASFRDFCIMCGTDYNKNIPKIGVHTSYKIISEYGTLDRIPLDVGILNHVRVREIFTVTMDEDLNVQHANWWCKVNIFSNKLDIFMIENNLCNVNVSNIVSSLTTTDIEVMMDDDTFKNDPNNGDDTQIINFQDEQLEWFKQ